MWVLKVTKTKDSNQASNSTIPYDEDRNEDEDEQKDSDDENDNDFKRSPVQTNAHNTPTKWFGASAPEQPGHQGQQEKYQ